MIYLLTMVKTKVKKRRKRLSKANKQTGSFGLWLKVGFVVLLLLIFFGSLFMIRGKRGEGFPKINYSLPLNSVASKSAALVTPSPKVTITPSPTEVPLSGFCLKVPVLMYHHIQPENVAKALGQTALTVDSSIFDEQMAYLSANGYTTLWANELVTSLINHVTLPAKSIVITMDDGYADNYIYALPILQKYHLKANLMLSTGLVGSNQDMLTWGQVNEMKSSGAFYFTNHTWSHWPVTRGPNSKIEQEIDTAQTQIEQYAGQQTNIFTYPYGSFDSNSIQILQKKGYLAAFSEIPGMYQCDSFLMTLHRTRVGNAPLSYYGI